MMKKIFILATAISLLLVLLWPALVQAETGITVSGNSAEAQFPLKLNFNISARSPVNITDVRLHYTVDQESYAVVTSEVYLDFVPATAINASWTWDMRRTGGLPPGTVVEYWWTVKDAGGGQVGTTPQKISFDDKRHNWQSLTEGKVTILWYDGGRSFAQELMSTAQEALKRLADETGAFLKNPVEIYVYADASDLQGAMVFPQEWTGGVAYTRFSAIAIGIAPGNLSWGKRATVHELTHLVTHQMTANPYNDLPTWLNEGMSMYSEGSLEPDYVNILKTAVRNNDLMTVRTLSSAFSTDPMKAYLAYAESYSLVEFLISTYGRDKMLGLYNAFSRGEGYYDGALEKVYGFDMDGLNKAWQDYAKRQYQGAGAVKGMILPEPAEIVSGLVSQLLLSWRWAAQGPGWGW